MSVLPKMGKTGKKASLPLSCACPYRLMSLFPASLPLVTPNVGWPEATATPRLQPLGRAGGWDI